MSPTAPCFSRHFGVEIGEMKKAPRRSHCKTVARVQTKKPNTRFMLCADVSSHIEFAKSSASWNGGKSSQSCFAHLKRNDAKPRLPIEGVQHQFRRQQGTQGIGGHRPMRKEQIRPDHVHRPRASRGWPRTMLNLFEHKKIQRCNTKALARSRLQLVGMMG